MKKNVKMIIVCSVVAFLLIAGVVTYAFLPHPLNYKISKIEPVGSTVEIVSKTDDCVTIRNTTGENFKILTFTDIHFDGKNKTSLTTATNLVDNIVKEKPDLVVFGGDTVTSGMNGVRAKQLGKIFEKLGVYWAPVLGNHEGDNNFSITRPEMVEIFSSFEHCLMLEGKDDVWGDGNYCVNILNSDGSLCQTLFMMDTGDEMSEEQKAEYNIPADKSPYDGLKDSQIKWYNEKLGEIKAEYGEFKSTVFIHIPIPEFKDAYETQELLYGDKRENICASGFNSGLFEAIKEGGSTQAVFCGHDHLNDFGVMYDGILLSYLQPSGYGSYTTLSRLGWEEKDWLQGYVKISYAEDGTFTQERHRNSENME